jgi:hypothetical protein
MNTSPMYVRPCLITPTYIVIYLWVITAFIVQEDSLGPVRSADASTI